MSLIEKFKTWWCGEPTHHKSVNTPVKYHQIPDHWKVELTIYNKDGDSQEWSQTVDYTSELDNPISEAFAEFKMWIVDGTAPYFCLVRHSEGTERQEEWIGREHIANFFMSAELQTRMVRTRDEVQNE